MNQLKKNMSKKQTDNQIIEEFEKEFSRIHRNGKDIGKHEPKWFFPEHITPRIVSDWLRPVLADQDRISREDERKKILAKLPKIKEPTIHEAVCDDSECMIRKQNYKGFNECLKEIKQIIIC